MVVYRDLSICQRVYSATLHNATHNAFEARVRGKIATRPKKVADGSELRRRYRRGCWETKIN